jgi:hypothetical protein
MPSVVSVIPFSFFVDIAPAGESAEPELARDVMVLIASN